METLYLKSDRLCGEKIQAENEIMLVSVILKTDYCRNIKMKQATSTHTRPFSNCLTSGYKILLHILVFLIY